MFSDSVYESCKDEKEKSGLNEMDIVGCFSFFGMLLFLEELTQAIKQGNVEKADRLWKQIDLLCCFQACGIK